MKKSRFAALTGLGIAVAATIACVGYSQDHPSGHQAMGHGGTSLFIAQMTPAEVVPPSASAATATGAFVVDPKARNATYDITWHALEAGGPRTIALYNMGSGRNGALLHTLCGAGTTACPATASGNVTGAWTGRISNKLLSELASARVYVEITGASGRGLLRAQLESNKAMVAIRNFVAHLGPMDPAGRGVGTAVMSETHFSDGRVLVFYEVTVANTSGEPQNATLVGTAGASITAGGPLTSRRALPKAAASRTTGTGGTLRGEFQVTAEQTDERFASRMIAAGDRQVGITVNTTRFPNGELAGVFQPVGGSGRS